jgi:hypothetical protein
MRVSLSGKIDDAEFDMRRLLDQLELIHRESTPRKWEIR